MKATSFALTPLFTATTFGAIVSAALATAACASEGEHPDQTSAGTQYETYLDAPQTPGTWTYFEEPAVRPGQNERSVAVYGPGKTAGPKGGEPLFLMVCDVATQRIGLSTKGDPSRPLAMRITTETTERELTAASPDGAAMVSAFLLARDPLLDAMAITKGRFVIDVEGEPPLYLPAWPEVSRVIEDCR